MTGELGEVREIVGAELSQAEAEALLGWYASLERGIDAFPAEELKGVEPPLRSVAGPTL